MQLGFQVSVLSDHVKVITRSVRLHLTSLIEGLDEEWLWATGTPAVSPCGSCRGRDSKLLPEAKDETPTPDSHTKLYAENPCGQDQDAAGGTQR